MSLENPTQKETLDWLTDLLGHAGWENLLKPAISNRMETIMKVLLRPDDQRKERLPDDFLRGQFQVLKWILEWPATRIAVIQQEMVEETSGTTIIDPFAMEEKRVPTAGLF